LQKVPHMMWGAFILAHLKLFIHKSRPFIDINLYVRQLLVLLQ